MRKKLKMESSFYIYPVYVMSHKEKKILLHSSKTDKSFYGFSSKLSH